MKYSYKIINLDCANCAVKLEEKLNKSNDFKNVIINFSTSKITYESNLENHLEVINNLVSKYEPGCKVINTNNTKKEYHLYIIIIALISYFIGCLDFKFSELFVILSYILLLYNPFKKAILMLIKSKSINENLLITISCIGAYFINSKMEGVMVVTLYLIGKILEEKAINKTRDSIREIVELKQDYANLLVNDNINKVDISLVKKDDILVIKKGEKVPVDGVVISGETLMDTSSITGESSLLEVRKDSLVYSGYINNACVINIKVINEYTDSMVFKILEMVETASNRKAKTETLVSRLTKYYTPIVLLLAIISYFILPLIFNISYHDSLYRSLSFLVISCPCAIAISVPLSYFTGLGVSSKHGILIKGSNYLDNLSHVNKVIFDKTGTLTNGEIEVSKIEILDNKYTEDEIIDLVLQGEMLSNHPIAKSLIKYFNRDIISSSVEDFKEIDGGISYKINNKKIIIGNKKICNCSHDVDLHINIDSKHVASIYLNDGIKENAKDLVNYLKSNNIRTYMFTGDNRNISKIIAESLNIDEVYSEMLPTDKYKKYEKIEESNDTIMYLGDGINDTPVLKRATIGVSMGKIGTDAAIQSSDIVIMNDNLDSIEKSINISKYTNLIIKQNLIFALSVKILILILSMLGITNMFLAVLADTGLTLLTILNTLRILIKFKK